MCCKPGWGRVSLHVGALLTFVICSTYCLAPDSSCHRFLVPVTVCMVLVGMVWFGLGELQTNLAGLGLADCQDREEVKSR